VVWVPDATEDDLQQSVDLRAERQRRWLSDTGAPRLRSIVDEAVFDRPVGGVDVAIEQIDFLIQWSRRPNVTLQLLPKSVGPFKGMGYSFAVLRFDDTPGMDVAYAEEILSATYYERPHEVQELVRLYEHIASRALSPVDTREALTTLRDALGSSID
jgi:hypothetical protein